APRPPAGDRVLSRVFSEARRPSLESRGLGVGRRTARRAASELALRRAGDRPSPEEVRRRARLRRAGPASRPQHVPGADDAEDDALGRRSARALPPRAALDVHPRPAPPPPRPPPPPPTPPPPPPP